MESKRPSRRTFLSQSGAALGGAWLGLNSGAVLAAAGEAAASLAADHAWAILSTEEAAGLAAVADQVLPPDDTPGAAELGAVHFMDAAFGGFMAGALPMVRAGLEDLDARAAESGAARFQELSFDAQTRVLRSVETTPFFGTVHYMTLVGVFALEAHGGNRGQGGWKLIGFEPRHVWQPPFGYYDAQAGGEGDDAGS